MLKDKISIIMGEEMELSKIEELLKNHEERIRRLELTSRQSEPSQKTGIKLLSIKEFLLDKSPKGGYQVGLTVAYYLEKYREITSITSEDLENAFREAKEPIPSNISDILYVNVQRGLMMEAKDRKGKLKAYNVTNTGEKFVENNFQK